MQKRDRLIDIEPDWVHLDTDENGLRMNSYCVQHPEMILGEMKMVSGRCGPEATCEPFENADLAELLNEAEMCIRDRLVTPEKLEYGKGYSLVEVQAPYGYVLDSSPVYFDVAEEHLSLIHISTNSKF